MRPLARPYQLVKTHGLRTGSREILKKLSGRLYEYHGSRAYIILAKRLDGDPVEERPRDVSRDLSLIEVREGEPEEILGLRSDDEPRARGYLAKNYKCALFVIRGEIAGWCWWIDPHVSEESSIDDQVRFFSVHLEEADVWFFDYYIVPTYRGKGRATKALENLENMLAARGCRRMMGYVEPTNIAALWLYKIRGFRPIATVNARYFFSLVGISSGRLVLRVNERRRPATFPFRPVRVQVWRNSG